MHSLCHYVDTQCSFRRSCLPSTPSKMLLETSASHCFCLLGETSALGHRASFLEEEAWEEGGALRNEIRAPSNTLRRQQHHPLPSNQDSLPPPASPDPAPKVRSDLPAQRSPGLPIRTTQKYLKIPLPTEWASPGLGPGISVVYSSPGDSGIESDYRASVLTFIRTSRAGPEELPASTALAAPEG